MFPFGYSNILVKPHNLATKYFSEDSNPRSHYIGVAFYFSYRIIVIRAYHPHTSQALLVTSFFQSLIPLPTGDITGPTSEEEDIIPPAQSVWPIKGVSGLSIIHVLRFCLLTETMLQGTFRTGYEAGQGI